MAAIIGLITVVDDSEYRELNQGFVDWYQRNYLQINAGKTEELEAEQSHQDVDITTATTYPLTTITNKPQLSHILANPDSCEGSV